MNSNGGYGLTKDEKENHGDDEDIWTTSNAKASKQK